MTQEPHSLFQVVNVTAPLFGRFSESGLQESLLRRALAVWLSPSGSCPGEVGQAAGQALDVLAIDGLDGSDEIDGYSGDSS